MTNVPKYHSFDQEPITHPDRETYTNMSELVNQTIIGSGDNHADQVTIELLWTNFSEIF